MKTNKIEKEIERLEKGCNGFLAYVHPDNEIRDDFCGRHKVLCSKCKEKILEKKAELKGRTDKEIEIRTRMLK